MDFLHKVEAIIVADTDGHRLFAKYFNPNLDAGSNDLAGSEWPIEKQVAFEAAIYHKAIEAKRSSYCTGDGDILLHEAYSVLYEVEPEVMFFVVGKKGVNELVLSQILLCLLESVQELLGMQSGQMSKRELLENFMVLVLCVDEMIDDGIILEINSSSIIAEVSPFVGKEKGGGDGVEKALDTFTKFVRQGAN